MNEDADRREAHRLDTEAELIRRMTAAMREADPIFERVGGSTRHYVRDCLMPVLAKHRLQLRLTDGKASEGQS